MFMVKQSCLFGWQINNLYKDHHMGNHGMPTPSKWCVKKFRKYHWGRLENFDSGGIVSDIHSNVLLKDFV